MLSKENFQYAALFQAETGEYCTNGSLPNLTMGPETAKRFAENDGCAVTICCITYNHEDYIRDALDSFLMQKTNFKFQVFVGEDHGTDATADIVREYAEKYPDLIIPFVREENMGAQANLIDLCNHANSPYIAFCEGDDFWIDEYKLQKQYDYMQAHPELRVCYTRAEISAPEDWFLRSWFKTNKEGKMIFPDCEPFYKKTKKPIDCFDCIWVFPAHTATVFYRWNYDVEIPDWYYTGIIGDHPIFLMQLGEGKAGFLKDVCAVYRRSNVGVYMSNDMNEHFSKTRIDHVRWMSGMLEWYQEHQNRYPRLRLENRLKLETYNYLNTMLKVNDYDAVLQFFADHEQVAKLSLKAYMSFYNDGRGLIKAFTWSGYNLIRRNKIYRYALRPYALLVKILEQCRKGAKFFAKACREVLSGVCYWWYSLFPKRKNLWVITSFRARGYMDNAKYFYEYILEHHPEIKLFWLTKDDGVYKQLQQEQKPVCKVGTRKCRKILSHAYIAVTDHNIMSDYENLSGFNHRIKVVQLWHGVGFKALGDGKVVKLVRERGVQYSSDILAKPGDGLFRRMVKKIKYFFLAPYRELFEEYFLFVCPGQERVDMIGKVWNIPEKSYFMAGHPRDILLHQMKPDAEQPKILFAPTFRYDYKKELELIDGCIGAFDAIETLMDEINGTFVIRLHPHTWRDYQSKITTTLKKYDRIILDREKDVYTSLGQYNMVISDYSSISLDVALLGRPAIYFCPDIEWFKKKQAGFNLDFERSIPGPITYTWQEVLENIRAYHENPEKDADFRKQRLQYFFDLSVNGPDNSARIVAEIKKRIGLE